MAKRRPFNGRPRQQESSGRAEGEYTQGRSAAGDEVAAGCRADGAGQEESLLRRCGGQRARRETCVCGGPRRGAADASSAERKRPGSGAATAVAGSCTGCR